MKYRLIPAFALVVSILAGCGGSSSTPRSVPAPPTENPDGTPTTDVITANFDPASGVLPFPINLLLSGSGDLTLNIPVADPTDFGDPQVALNALDGFSTVSPWTFSFSAPVDPSTINGGSVRLFQVQFVFGTIAVQQVVTELVPGQDYVATVAGTDPTGRTIAIVPLRPLDEMTGYMAVVTDAVQDAEGNPATPSQTYFLAKRTEPLVTEGGVSTDPLLDNATAQALEPVRQLVNAQESAAEAVGIARDDIVLSWTATTQSITPVLNVVRSTLSATSSTLAPTGLTTADVLPPGASPGIADVFIGVIELPYFLGVPSAENPTAPLNQFWEASPGNYIPPFDTLGLDPSSTNVTVANPIPVERARQTAPVLVTVPNQFSGQVKPPGGWPVVIFQHGITGNRSQALALADTMASIGVVVVSMDLPLHGITQTNPMDPTQPLAALYIGNTPFGAIPGATERTFDLDLQDNASGAPGPDGQIDSSGAFFINLQSLLTARDNLRQGQVDLSTLALNVPFMDIDGDSVSDFDGSSISFAGLSLGSIVGTGFLAVEPTVNTGVLSVPGGGIANLLAASPTFGPVIRAGLQQAGVEPDSPEFFQFLGAAQQVVDSADPINWSEVAVLDNSILLHEVIGDTVVPNSVPGAPLSGTEPMIRIMGLESISATTQNAAGVRAAVRFNPGSHGSLLDPSASPATTAEMQGQAASLIASGGTTVIVNDASVIQTD
ncbi:MAG TPA: Ig-like domain-containing protein [Wenzhouxiangellaceae bacterium]|nr:Ig-like domain-containing protein [Wenzhouxiangellaceae bacterium]